MHRGPTEKVGPLSFYDFTAPGAGSLRSGSSDCALVPRPLSYAPQGVRATAIPTGTIPQVTTTNRRGDCEGAYPPYSPPCWTCRPAPRADPRRASCFWDRVPPLLNNKKTAPPRSTMEAGRGPGAESKKRTCQFHSDRVKWKPRGTEIMRRTPGAGTPEALCG